MVETIGKSHQLEGGDRLCMSFGATYALVEEWDFHVFNNGEFTDQIECLEDESDTASSNSTQSFVLER